MFEIVQIVQNSIFNTNMKIVNNLKRNNRSTSGASCLFFTSILRPQVVRTFVAHRYCFVYRNIFMITLRMAGPFTRTVGAFLIRLTRGVLLSAGKVLNARTPPKEELTPVIPGQPGVPGIGILVMNIERDPLGFDWTFSKSSS